MKLYADYEFYAESYLLGRVPKIPDAEFSYWAMRASGEIRNRTFGHVDILEEVPEEVQMCCCEVAEKLYMADSARGNNGMILQSFGNDGETGTYKVDELSESSVRKNISRSVRKWLSGTELLYCGVE